MRRARLRRGNKGEHRAVDSAGYLLWRAGVSSGSWCDEWHPATRSSYFHHICANMRMAGSADERKYWGGLLVSGSVATPTCAIVGE